MKIALLSATALAGSLLSGPAMALDTSSLKVCGDGANWPPFHYKKRRKLSKAMILMCSMPSSKIAA